MHMCLLQVVVTSKGNSDSLHNLLIIVLLVDTILRRYIANLDLIDSQTVNPLAGSFNDRAFLDQELVGVVPVATLVNFHLDGNTLFLKLELVDAFFKSRDHDIVDTLLVSGVFLNLYLTKQICHILVLGFGVLKEGQIGGLHFLVLERQSESL